MKPEVTLICGALHAKERQFSKPGNCLSGKLSSKEMTRRLIMEHLGLLIRLSEQRRPTRGLPVTLTDSAPCARGMCDQRPPRAPGSLQVSHFWKKPHSLLHRNISEKK